MLPVVLVPTTLFLVTIAWTFALTGALHGHPAVRIGILLLYVATAIGWNNQAITGDIVESAVSWGAVVGVPILFALRWRGSARPLPEFTIVLLIVSAGFAALQAEGAETWRITGVALLLGHLNGEILSMTLLILPLLMVLGMGIADFTRQAATWTVEIVDSRLPAWISPWLLLGFVLWRLREVAGEVGARIDASSVEAAALAYAGGLATPLAVGLAWLVITRGAPIVARARSRRPSRVRGLQARVAHEGAWPAVDEVADEADQQALVLVVIYAGLQVLGYLVLTFGLPLASLPIPGADALPDSITAFIGVLNDDNVIFGWRLLVDIMAISIGLVQQRRRGLALYLVVFGLVDICALLIAPNRPLGVLAPYGGSGNLVDLWWVVLFTAIGTIWLVRGHLTPERASRLPVRAAHHLVAAPDRLHLEPIQPVLWLGRSGVHRLRAGLGRADHRSLGQPLDADAAARHPDLSVSGLYPPLDDGGQLGAERPRSQRTQPAHRSGRLRRAPALWPADAVRDLRHRAGRAEPCERASVSAEYRVRTSHSTAPARAGQLTAPGTPSTVPSSHDGHNRTARPWLYRHAAGYQSTPPIDRRHALAGLAADLSLLVLIAVVAALARLIFLSSSAPAFVTPDSDDYLWPGYALAHGLGFEPELRRTPLYPFVIAAIMAGGGTIGTIVVVQHGVGVLTAMATYVLGRVAFGSNAPPHPTIGPLDRHGPPAPSPTSGRGGVDGWLPNAGALPGRLAGLLAGLAVAISGPLIIYEHFLMSEAFFTFVLTLALLALVVALRRPTRGWLLLAGALVGATALTRPIGQALVPLALVLPVLVGRPLTPSPLSLCAGEGETGLLLPSLPQRAVGRPRRGPMVGWMGPGVGLPYVWPSARSLGGLRPSGSAGALDDPQPGRPRHDRRRRGARAGADRADGPPRQGLPLRRPGPPGSGPDPRGGPADHPAGGRQRRALRRHDHGPRPRRARADPGPDQYAATRPGAGRDRRRGPAHYLSTTREMAWDLFQGRNERLLGNWRAAHDPQLGPQVGPAHRGPARP